MNIKKLLLGIVVVILGLALVLGAIFGIAFLAGAFDEKVIAIRTLYFENPTNAQDTTIKDLEIRTLEDFKSKISYLPADATKRTLSVVVSGSGAALDNFPTTVTAGEEFDIKLAKDDHGNNIGGAVKLKFTDESGQAVCYIKVAVDVVSTDNSIYFTNTSGSANVGNDGVTQLVMSKSGDESTVVFKSSLGNALTMHSGFTFNTPEYNNHEKNIIFTKKYVNLDGEAVEVQGWNPQVQYETVNGSRITTYTFAFKPTTTGILTIKAKMHRTYEIEEIFKSQGFADFEEVYALDESKTDTIAFENLVYTYNNFINNYLNFFTADEMANRFFNQHKNNSGLVSLSKLDSILASLDYVFISTEIQISVVSVQLTDISVRNEAVTYSVFENEVYTIESLKDASGDNSFGVNIEIDNENIEDYDVEINRLFEKVTMNSYVFKEENVDNVSGAREVFYEKDDYDMPIGMPIIYNRDIHSGITPDGYLIPSDKYLSVSHDKTAKTWTVKANMPILEDNGEAKDKVYVVFETTSIDVDNGTPIVKNTVAEVFVNYTEYVGSISLNELKDITLNSELSSNDYAKQKQTLSLNVDALDNRNQVEYTKTLYFVEKNSNIEDGNPKIFTSGFSYSLHDGKKEYNSYVDGSIYKFIDIETGKYLTIDSEGRHELEGLRVLDGEDGLPTLLGVNASDMDVNVFAVVVMTDAMGNIIDRDGNIINIIDTPTEVDGQMVYQCDLVVVASTYHYFEDNSVDVNNVYSVNVTAFMDNVNFYTKAGGDITLEGSDGTPYISVVTNDFYKRNFEDTRDEENKIVEYNNEIKMFKRLKLLVGQQFELYITNHDLDTNGIVATSDKLIKYIKYKDINGVVQEIQNVQENTRNNREIALKKIDWNGLNTYYKLNINPNVSVTVDPVPTDDEYFGYIKLILNPRNVVASGTSEGVDLTLDLANDIIPYCNIVNDRVRYSVQTFDITKVELNPEKDFTYHTELYSRYTKYSDLLTAAESASGGDPVRKEEILRDYRKILTEYNHIVGDTDNAIEQLYSVDDFFNPENNGVIDFDLVTDLYTEEELELAKIDMSKWDLELIKEYIATYTQSINYGAEFVVADEVSFIGSQKINATFDENSGKYYLNMSGALDLRDKETSVIFEILDSGEGTPKYVEDQYGMRYHITTEGDEVYLDLSQNTYASIDNYVFILGNRYSMVTHSDLGQNGTTLIFVNINSISYGITVDKEAFKDYIDYTEVVIEHYNGQKILNFKKGESDGKRVYMIYKLGFGLTTQTTYERYLYQLLIYDVYETPVMVVLRNPDGYMDIVTDGNNVQTAVIKENSENNSFVINEDARSFDMIFSTPASAQSIIDMVVLLDSNTIRRYEHPDYGEVIEGVRLTTHNNYLSHLLFELDAADTSMRFAENETYTDQLTRRAEYIDNNYGIDTINVQSSFDERMSYLNLRLGDVDDRPVLKFSITIKPDLSVTVKDLGMDVLGFKGVSEGEDAEYIYMSMKYDTSTSNNNTYLFSDLFNLDANGTGLITINRGTDMLSGTLSTIASNGNDRVPSVNEAVSINNDFGRFTIQQNYLIYSGLGSNTLKNDRKSFDIYIYCLDGDRTIPYSKRLKVFVDPTYTIDVTKLNVSNENDMQYIYNGVNLYNDRYISVYNGMSIDITDRLDESTFNTLFDLSIEGESYQDTSLVLLPKTYNTTRSISIKLNYKLNSNSNSTNNSIKNVDISLHAKLVGMELYYNESGSFGVTDDYDAIKLSGYDNKITDSTNFTQPLFNIEVQSGTTLDIYKYLRLYAANGEIHYAGGNRDSIRLALGGLDTVVSGSGNDKVITYNSVFNINGTSYTDSVNNVLNPSYTTKIDALNLTFNTEGTTYYQNVTCTLDSGVSDQSITIAVYVVAYNYNGDSTYATLYQLGTINIIVRSATA